MAEAKITKAHLKEHLDLFFGIRNKRSFQPIENVNYTLETLSYMTPRKIADDITRDIVSRMPFVSRPFIVFECCAGTGGNTFSFADNPAVKLVYAFERDPIRQEMLKRNIEAYGFENKVGVGGEFPGVPEDPQFAGSVLYMDPPWLPAGIPGEKSTVDQYILAGMKVGPYTLEEWINQSQHCALIVMRVPPGYQLGKVKGKVEVVDLKKSRLYFITSEQGMRVAEQKSVLGFDAIVREKFTQMTSPEWIQNFRIFIYTILGRIITDHEIKLRMIDAESTSIWLMAFTHESFDRNKNYEDLEIIGDRALEYDFTKYIKRKFPQSTKKEITQLKRAYMSRKQSNKQPEYARMLGFGPYIRFLGLDVNDVILEDVFESFFGALDEVSDRIKDGLGAINTYNFLKSIFDEVGIDYGLATEGEKSIVHERFNQFGWGQPIERDEQTEGGVHITVSLTPAALTYLSRKGLVNMNPVIGDAVARTKIPASKAAYAQALRTIESFGIQPEKLEEERKKAALHNQALQPYIAPTKARLSKEGFIDYEFFVPKTSATYNGYLVELFGIRRDGTKTLLRANLAESKERGESIVLAEYASGH